MIVMQTVKSIARFGAWASWGRMYHPSLGPWPAEKEDVAALEEEAGRKFVYAIRFTVICVLLGMAIKIFPSLGMPPLENSFSYVIRDVRDSLTLISLACPGHRCLHTEAFQHSSTDGLQDCRWIQCPRSSIWTDAPYILLWGIGTSPSPSSVSQQLSCRAKLARPSPFHDESRRTYI